MTNMTYTTSHINKVTLVINLFDLGGSEGLIKKGYEVENLMDFPGH